MADPKDNLSKLRENTNQQDNPRKSAEIHQLASILEKSSAKLSSAAASALQNDINNAIKNINQVEDEGERNKLKSELAETLSGIAKNSEEVFPGLANAAKAMLKSLSGENKKPKTEFTPVPPQGGPYNRK